MPPTTQLIHYSDDDSFAEIGVDEVGRGCLFGRVYVAAVCLEKHDPDFDYSALKDSKKFSGKPAHIICNVADNIRKHALAYSVQFEEHTTIDEINILQATQRAMHRAVLDVRDQLKQHFNYDDDAIQIMVDGNYFNPIRILDRTTQHFAQLWHKCVEKGDGTYLSIAAASILAKVARDQYIADMCAKYPGLDTIYGFASNKSYGTPHHMVALKQYGRTEWHRRSFKPVPTMDDCDPCILHCTT